MCRGERGEREIERDFEEKEGARGREREGERGREGGREREEGVILGCYNSCF